MVDVPAATPVTIPVDAPTVAVAVVTDVQTPPASPPELLRVVVVVGQRAAVPRMEPAFGDGLTVTTIVVTAVPQLLVAE